MACPLPLPSYFSHSLFLWVPIPLRWQVVPHFPSGIVKQVKCESVKVTPCKKGEMWHGVIFTCPHVSLALLSLRENEGLQSWSLHSLDLPHKRAHLLGSCKFEMNIIHPMTGFSILGPVIQGLLPFSCNGCGCSRCWQGHYAAGCNLNLAWPIICGIGISLNFKHGISVFANFSYGFVVLGTPKVPLLKGTFHLPEQSHVQVWCPFLLDLHREF